MANRERLEITAVIGCPVNCSKYCPQEILVQKYNSSKKMLSLNDFKQALSTVPESVEIVFSGFCEPFTNKQILEMATYAESKHHSITFFTTLVGANKENIDELCKLDLKEFWLHILDGENTKYPITQEYMNNVFTVIRKIRNTRIELMNNLFPTNHREQVTRGTLPTRRRIGHCKYAGSDFVLLPNGDVQLCCMDFGLQHKIGNLLTEDYETIKKNFFDNKPYELCHYCILNQNSLRFFAKKIVNRREKKS